MQLFSKIFLEKILLSTFDIKMSRFGGQERGPDRRNHGINGSTCGREAEYIGHSSHLAEAFKQHENEAKL